MWSRKIVGSYMGENAYTSVAWRVDPINQKIQRSGGETDLIGTKW